MASFAARDQENLINAHQQAAASKPLNQSVRGLQPKTPGQKSFQTPFRKGGNDENANLAAKGGKAGKNAAKENIQLTIGGKGKQAALTPAPQTQARNALAPKTTNAKAKFGQTPAVAGVKPDAAPKTNQRPASLRRSKMRNGLGHDTKLQIPVDTAECSSPEIEAIHPRPPDMEDIDDDFPPLDLSMFDPAKGGIDPDTLPHLMMMQRAHAKGPDGLSFLQRHAKKDEDREKILELRVDAEIMRRAESDLLPCYHNPECHDGECKDWPEQLRRAEEKYNETMKDLVLPEEREVKKAEEAKKISVVKSRELSKGPSDTASRRAASALAMRPKSSSSRHAPTASRDYSKPWLAGSKGVPAPEGYEGRHAAAVAASKTQLGFRKGRIASANVRGRVIPTDDQGQDTVRKVARPGKIKSERQTLEEMFEEVQQRKRLENGEPAEAVVDAKDDLDLEAEQDFVLEF